MVYRKKAFVAPQIYCYKGDAFIKSGGLRFYLGRWNGQGTSPPSVMQHYLRTVAELEEQFERGERPSRPDAPIEELLIDIILARYLRHLFSNHLFSQHPRHVCL